MDSNDHPLSRPTSVAGLVDYQGGSIVSRTLVKKSSGTVTLFAFDAGQGLSEHSTPHDAVVQVLEGEGEITVGGNLHQVETGQGLLLPANVPHAVWAASPFKMMLVMIREPLA